VLDQKVEEGTADRRKVNEEKVDLKKLFDQLEKEGISNVLVEGGGEIKAGKRLHL
jgi:riboflavin biosynthesis pyrimidine reductase